MFPRFEDGIRLLDLVFRLVQRFLDILGNLLVQVVGVPGLNVMPVGDDILPQLLRKRAELLGNDRLQASDLFFRTGDFSPHKTQPFNDILLAFGKPLRLTGDTGELRTVGSDIGWTADTPVT